MTWRDQQQNSDAAQREKKILLILDVKWFYQSKNCSEQS
jgi:hypothetical protein